MRVCRGEEWAGALAVTNDGYKRRLQTAVTNGGYKRQLRRFGNRNETETKPKRNNQHLGWGAEISSPGKSSIKGLLINCNKFMGPCYMRSEQVTFLRLTLCSFVITLNIRRLLLVRPPPGGAPKVTAMNWSSR